MKCVVHLDMDPVPKPFDDPESAIEFVETTLRKMSPDLTIKWRRDEFYPNNYVDYTLSDLLEEINKSSEAILQNVRLEPDGQHCIGEIATIWTAEKDAKESAEAMEELQKFGKEYAETLGTTVIIGSGTQQHVFEPPQKPRRQKRKKKKK